MLRLDVERVSAEAREIHLGRALLTLVVGGFWLLGWLTAKLVIGAGTAITFALAAAKVGWQDAHSTRAGRDLGTP